MYFSICLPKNPPIFIHLNRFYFFLENLTAKSVNYHTFKVFGPTFGNTQIMSWRGWWWLERPLDCTDVFSSDKLDEMRACGDYLAFAGIGGFENIQPQCRTHKINSVTVYEAPRLSLWE